jgi:molybdate transport system ATP-binding protein
VNNSAAVLRVNIRLPLPQFQLECCFQAMDEAVVIFGPSGAGKTSVFDCLAGFRKPQVGEITLGERVLFCSDRSVNLPVRERRIGYLSQQPALFPHLSVRRNIEYGLFDLQPDERDARVDAILRRFRIEALAESRPARISGGEQQRVVLARTLVCEPELLLLDEPLAALDLRLKSLLLEALFEWQRERSVPMLYVTHDQAEAYSLSRRVLVMEAGRVVADGEPHQVFSAPISHEQAALSGYENLLEAVVREVHPALGTMTCDVAGTSLSLESPLGSKAAGETVLLGLRAGDILVATTPPSGISARNVLAGQIRIIEERAGMVELQVLCDAESDAGFRVHITRGALQTLDLRVGQSVWLVIKTHSIQLLRSDVDRT